MNDFTHNTAPTRYWPANMTKKGTAMLIAEQDWRSVAACWSAVPDLFFPVSSSGKALEQAAEAKAICARCRVRRECLAFALATHQMHGVWGGTSEQERYLLRRADGRRTDPGTGDGCAHRLPADDGAAPEDLARQR
jgi:WhiB family redox-sensing transcriptional regulator